MFLNSSDYSPKAVSRMRRKSRQGMDKMLEGFMASLALPRFTYFLYYSDKIDQVLDSSVCAHIYFFFTCIYHVPLKKCANQMKEDIPSEK